MKNKNIKLPFVTKNSKHLVGTSGDDLPALINRAAMGRARFIIYPWFIFFNRAAMGRARFLLCTGFFFFSFLCHQTQTSADVVFINQSQAKLPLGQMSSPNDVIISQLQAISQLFTSYLPSGKFCLVSELNIHIFAKVYLPKLRKYY